MHSTNFTWHILESFVPNEETSGKIPISEFNMSFPFNWIVHPYSAKLKIFVTSAGVTTVDNGSQEMYWDKQLNICIHNSSVSLSSGCNGVNKSLTNGEGCRFELGVRWIGEWWGDWYGVL